MHITTHWDWAQLGRICEAETRRTLRAHPEFEDAVQEALLRAWKQRAGCRSQSAPQAWVSQIARREAVRAGTSATRRSVRSAALETAADVSADDVAEAIIDSVDVRRAMTPLSRAERKLLALRYVDELTHPQIAAALAIPEGTVKVRLHRLRKRLRTPLEAGR